ncbi:XRE family transcriptional regulator, partial [Streptomyces prunicolor]
GEPPAWCSWMSPADLLVDSGQCLRDLGQPERGHQLIGEGVTLLPDARKKTTAVFLSYDADSLLQAGQVDQAAATAHESLLLARQIGAPRCVAVIRDMLPGFEKYTGAERVDELLELARSR